MLTATWADMAFVCCEEEVVYCCRLLKFLNDLSEIDSAGGMDLPF